MSAFGQGYTFRVLANKGTNQIKKAGTANPVTLKTGATINAGDELIVSKDAYIGLMHKTGKTIEVKEPGTLTVAELEKKIAANNTSVAGKYAQFIAAKMGEEGQKSLASRMNATGAVSRAVGDGAIGVMLPTSGTTVLGDRAVVRWNAPEGAPSDIQYVVTVKNIFDEVIIQDVTSKSMIDLDFTQENISSEALLIFSVMQKGNEEVKSADFGIKKVMPGDMSEVEENYKGLQGEVDENDSPLNKLIYASFFEENGLILDALTKYEEAIKMSPDVEEFQSLYKDFLMVNQLVAQDKE
jgi:hypothetical protein